MNFKQWWEETGIKLMVLIMMEEGVPQLLAIAMVKKYEEPMMAAYANVFLAGAAAQKMEQEKQMDAAEKEIEGNTDDNPIPPDLAAALHGAAAPAATDFCIHCTYPIPADQVAAIRDNSAACPNCGRHEKFIEPRIA